MKIRAIALNTFKEATRNKIYYLLIFFGIFFVLSSKLVTLLTIGDKVKVLKDLGLASINFFSVLIAIFTGIDLVYKEIEKKTIYNILSKPISRSCFIIGKFFGLALTLFVALISMVVIFFLFMLLFSGELDVKILVYFILLYFELLIITSISLLFSSISTPLLSSVFTISLYLIGHVIWTFNEFKDKIINPVIKVISYILYYTLPNLEKFNIKNSIVMNVDIDIGMILSSICYAIFYITALLTLTILIFNKREFQ
jgi:ABC-type transport system involved in multi-copper enzyme maturation permease subunit